MTAQLRQVVMVDDLKGYAGANCWNDKYNQRDMCTKPKDVVQEKNAAGRHSAKQIRQCGSPTGETQYMYESARRRL